jgi:hypothetical protein
MVIMPTLSSSPGMIGIANPEPQQIPPNIVLLLDDQAISDALQNDQSHLDLFRHALDHLFLYLHSQRSPLTQG